MKEIARNGRIFNGLALGLRPAAGDCWRNGEDGLENGRFHGRRYPGSEGCPEKRRKEAMDGGRAG